jgi:hypothetical protein
MNKVIIILKLTYLMNLNKLISLICLLLFIFSCGRKQSYDSIQVNSNESKAINRTDILKERNQQDSSKIINKNLTLEKRVELLRESYQKYVATKTSDTIIYQEQFFNAFPDNYMDFEAIYGYDEVSDVESPLHKNLIFVGHIDTLFNNLRIIDKNLYYNKLINLSVEAKWDADNGTFLQKGLRQHVYADLSLTTSILSKYNDEDIKSFWYFFFDEPHPNEKMPNELKNIEDKRILNLMQQSYRQVQKDSSED